MPVLTRTQSIALVDSRLADIDLLLAGLPSGLTPYILHPNEAIISQIDSLLQDAGAIHSLYLIGHGRPGVMQLGAGELDAQVVAEHQEVISGWNISEILLYGCAVGQDVSLVKELHRVTGAGVAASRSLLGQGNWELDVRVGVVSVSPHLGSYPGVLVRFENAPSVGVGASPRSVELGDVNGDGNLDFVTANQGFGNVSVRLGNGAGGFTNAADVTVGDFPESVALGDVNGDGNLDFVTANALSNTVSVRLGNGTGGFSGTTNIGVGVTPVSVTLGDVNGDGNLDILTANEFSDNVSVRLGDGAGGFTNAADVAVGNGPQSVALGDVNGDGNLDFVTANALSNTVSVRLGNGTGGFSGTTNIGVGVTPVSVTLGDVNGDGNLDILTANEFSDNVSVRLGDGAGGFTNAADVAVGNGPQSVALGDVNGDGNLDFVTANSFSNNVSVRLGNGAGGFSGTTNIGVGVTPVSVALGDVDGDGNLDFVTANSSPDNVSVLLNTTPRVNIAAGTNPEEGGANGTFTITLNEPAPVGGLTVTFNLTGSTASTPSDFSLAASTNITAVTATSFTIAAGATTATLAVVANPDAAIDPDETVVLNLESGDSYLLGNSAARFVAQTAVGVGVRPISVALGDVNGDGNLDFVTANSSSDTVSVRLGDGKGGFTGTTNIGVGNAPRSVTLGDVNGDGNLDILTANRDSNNVSVRLGDGAGGFTNAGDIAVGSTPESVALADVDGDGDLDFLTANSSSNTVSVLLNTTPRVNIAAGTNPEEGGANGTFTITLNEPAPTGGLTVTFNLTGSTATTPSDFSLSQLASTNITAVTANSFTIAAGATTATLAVVANPDAVNDPDETVVLNLENGNGYLLGNSTARFVPQTAVGVGATPVSVTLGDVNGDGNLDILAVNESSETVSVRLGNGAGGFSGTTNIGVGAVPSELALGDVNGDGNLDILTANLLSDNVSVRLGNGAGGFSGTTNIGVGDAPSALALGDVNGDGNLDILTANASSNTVSVRLGDGAGGFSGTTNIGVGVQPVSVTLGDVNRDGNLDLLTANASSNTVSVRLGDGAGGFSGTTNIGVGVQPVSVTLGDVNKDGNLDILAANASSNTVSVRLGNGAGGFSGTTNIAVGNGPQSVALGDVNGDGKLDILTTNRNSSNVSVRLGDGLGGFSGTTNIGVGNAPVSVALGDVNGDGDLDILTANSFSNNVSVLLNQPGAVLTITNVIDTKAPTLVINLSDTDLKIGETSTVTFQFSEAVTGFVIGDIAAQNGALSGFTTVDADTFTATFTPNVNVEDATNIISVVNNSYTDIAGNAGVGASSSNYSIDTKAPTLVINLSDTALTVGETSTITFQFSEAVSGFVIGDIVAQNGALSGFTTVDADTFTATFTPTAGVEDATNIISVVNNSYTDIAGNLGTGDDSDNYTIDTKAPTLTIGLSDTALKSGETSTVTFQFSEAVSGFDSSDVAVQNGTLSNFTAVDADTFTASFTPNPGVEDATNIISVANNSYTDIAGNAGVGASSSNYSIDTKAPTLTISLSDTALKIDETSTVTFQFSEAVSGFAIGDIVAQNGALSGFTAVDGDTFTATFTPNTGVEDATNIISVVNNSYTDIVGNLGTGDDSDNYTIDTKAPTLTIGLSDTALKSGETSTVTFQFSEAVSGFDSSDVAVQNGTLSNFTAVDADTFTASFTPNPGVEDATNIISVASNSYTDIAGNAGAGDDSDNYSIDTKAPTVNITTTDTKADINSPITYSLQFSESIVGDLNASDFVNAGSASINITALTKVNDSQFTLKVTSSTGGNITLQLNPIGTITDLNGNGLVIPATDDETLNVLLVGGQGDDTITGTNGDDTINAGEGNNQVFGLAGKDTITAGSGDDQIDGGSGDDIIWAGSGDDRIFGGAGNDILAGEGSDDRIEGGNGNDTLIGGAGNDKLTGGLGSDRFTFDTNSPFNARTLGIDTITDFNFSQDFIVIDQTTFNAFAASAATPTGKAIDGKDFAVVTSDGAAGSSSALIVYNSNSGALFYNQNKATTGLGTGGQFATLQTGLTELQLESRILLVV